MRPGYIVKYGGLPLSWKSKRQSTLTLSTTEAELPLNEVTKEALRIIQLFKEMSIPFQLPIPVQADNTRILLAEHPVFIDALTITIFARAHNSETNKIVKLIQSSSCRYINQGLNKVKL